MYKKRYRINNDFVFYLTENDINLWKNLNNHQN